MTIGLQVFIRARVGQGAVEVDRAFAAAGSDARGFRFGFSIDEIILCGTGAKASDNPSTASRRLAGRRSRTNSQGFAMDLDGRKSGDLARHLNRSSSHPAARRSLDDKPVGRPPSVSTGEAEGIKRDGVAAFST